MSLLSSNNTAFFTTCGRENLPFAIAALLSIRRFLPEANLFLISHNLTDDEKNSLHDFRITFLDLDLRSFFIRHWFLSAEDFYYLSIPELLLNRGFDYSVFISPTYRFVSHPFRQITPPDDISCLKVKSSFSSHLLYFNNEKMKSLHVSSLAIRLFQESLLSTPLDTPDALLNATLDSLSSTFSCTPISSFHRIKSSKLPRPAKSPNYPTIETIISEDCKSGLYNFGDEFTKVLLPSLFKRSVSPHRGPKGVDLFATGSVLFELPNIDLDHPIYCWGSGFLSDEPITNEVALLRHLTFTAVRGQLTLDRVKKAYPSLSIPLGDPGILANHIYKPNPVKINRIGIVPHYIDCDHPIVQQLRTDDRFFIIDPLDPPATVASQISSCPFVFSSSLHGLIFADSFNIPNAHIQFSDKVYGGEYKFKDYASGVDKVHLDADLQKIYDSSYVDYLSKKYQPIKNLKNRQQALIDAFPRELL